MKKKSIYPLPVTVKKCTPNGLISSRVMKEGVHGIKYMPDRQEVERLK